MEFILSFLINVVFVYKLTIFARILISWIQISRANPIVAFIYQVTEPVLKVFRGILPHVGIFDLSPIIAFIALDLVQMGLAQMLASL
ncbi:MAG: YggT family protein [Candidatus Peregrinibacteria bacterium]|nr:YggT family protein [Candidatus Peregrinibacteria bacterium]